MAGFGIHGLGICDRGIDVTCLTLGTAPIREHAALSSIQRDEFCKTAGKNPRIRKLDQVRSEKRKERNGKRRKKARKKGTSESSIVGEGACGLRRQGFIITEIIRWRIP